MEYTSINEQMNILKIKKTNTLKAILFDMVGVLIFKKDGYIPKTVDEFNALKIEKLYNHVDDQKLLKDIKQKLHLSDKKIKKALPFIPAKFEIFPELWTQLPKLKTKYKIAVINNGNAIAKDYWEERFNFDIFDLFINSAIEKIGKPDTAIYLLTCNRLGVNPKECLFMDDSLENIEAAKALEMETIWWNKEEGRESALNKFKKITKII